MQPIITLAVVALFASFSAQAAESPVHEPLSQELVDYVNSLGTTWTAGHNERLKGMPLDTIKGMMGLLPGRQHMPALVMKHPARVISELPEEFDARKQWPNCPSIAEIRDEGACGSSWALAAVEAITDRICIHSKGAEKPHISAENLNNCCDSECFGCGGGFPGAAWAYWTDTGLVTGGNFNSSEGCQPYSIAPCDHHVVGHLKPCGEIQATPQCEHKCEANYNVAYTKDLRKGASSYTVDSDPANIQAEIQKNGPVEASISVYADFLAYKSGVYKHTTGDVLGGLAVKIFGWGVENGTPFWWAANSWNEDWGDKGLFKILRGTDDCDIEDAVVAGLPE